MDYDPIADIRKLGYTFGEARFLSLVGAYGGYFLRRQFTRYLGRSPGSVDQSLVEKGLGFGHLRPLDYGSRRRVYQLTSTAIDYLLGHPLPRSKRTKGDREIKSRLLVFDYVLDHVGTRFLASSVDKVDYFSDDLNIALDCLPRRPRIEPGRTEAAFYFDDLSPIALLEGFQAGPPLVSVVFVDGGNQTDAGFRFFLARYRPLLERLERFEVVYVSDSKRNFAPAAALFHQAFPPGRSPLVAKGASHFADSMRARLAGEDDPQAPDARGRELLEPGGDLTASARQENIDAAWKRGERGNEIPSGESSEERPGSIRGYLMRASYPPCVAKLRKAR
jgi:hypothetical protein